MDREIPKEERRKRLRRQVLVGTGIVAVGFAAIMGLTRWAQSGVQLADLKTSTVERGAIEVSVAAVGRVVPAAEELMTSPITSRIVEVYCKEGDSVAAGTPILRLDLQSTETSYRKLLDEEQMKHYQLEQLRLNNLTRLSDLQMNIRVSEMKLNRLEVELRNERYLDSLGSGTTDKVRQAELAYNTGCLELEQLRQQYTNEQQVREADLKVKNLELEIFRKNLAETRRTLEDAQIRAPRAGILTYINSQIGTQVSQGSQVATLSDLSNFKLEVEMADAYADRVRVGAKAVIRIGTDELEGRVTSITPLSKDGIISFVVHPLDPRHRRLRSGLNADVHVVGSVKDNALRIANGSYYLGSGQTQLFVLSPDGQTLNRRTVRLGESSYRYVEVVEGLNPGEQVVISDMARWKEYEKLKVER